MTFTAVIWGIAGAGLLLSWAKSREKTLAALRFFLKSFLSLAPSIVAIIWAIGFILTFLPSEQFLRTIGPEAGLQGIILAAVLGSVVLIPAFIAFPLAASFIRQGADIGAIAAFVTTLVMVGVLTALLEAKSFGKRFALWRNSLSFVFALVIAIVMGAVLR
ncbi:MAG: permease [Candidatus Moduliflexus flocculans]|nr:permease [Candidatus Moduliflexus flocculans]